MLARRGPGRHDRQGICAILLGDDPETLPHDLAGALSGGAASSATTGRSRRRWPRSSDLIEAPAQALDLPLDPRGTRFQQRVWQALREIPAGSTASYGEIAERIGAPKEAHAVGEACAANVIAVAIPCHRVVRKDGGLAGYRWGFRRKRALLKRERAA